MNPSFSLVAVGICSLLFNSSVSHAADIYGCVRNPGGILRIVSGPGRCSSWETLITWNHAGPQGVAGPPGLQGAKGDPAPPPERWRFAGFTSQLFAGSSATWMELSRACYVEFPGGRLATSADFKNAVNPPDVPAIAHIAPTPPITTEQDLSNTTRYYLDAAGVFYANQPEVPGTGVHTNGRIAAGFDSSVPRPVACAAPEQ